MASSLTEALLGISQPDPNNVFLQTGRAISAAPVTSAYASPGKNLAYSVGAGLLGALLGAYGIRQDRQERAQMRDSARELLSGAPEERATQILNAYPRLEPVYYAKREEEEEQKRALDKLSQELGMRRDAEIEQYQALAPLKLAEYQKELGMRNSAELGLQKQLLGMQSEKIAADPLKRAALEGETYRQALGFDPIKESGKLFDELKKETEFKSNVAAITQAYDDAKNISTAKALTPFAKESAQFNAVKSVIGLTAQSTLKGVPSDRDQKIIERLVPKPTDTKAQIEAKRDEMIRYVASRRETQPRLERLRGAGLNFTDQGIVTRSASPIVQNTETNQLSKPKQTRIVRNKLTGEVKTVEVE